MKKSARTNQVCYAVVMKSTGKICRDLHAHFSLWQHKADALKDCPTYAEVIMVRVSELRAK